MKRLNITLPDDVACEIKNIPNKSRFIAKALRKKLERIKRVKLEQLLTEGYKATSQEDRETNEEWEKATLEEWK